MNKEELEKLHNDELRLKQIQKELKIKNLEEKMKMIVDDRAMKVVYQALYDVMEGEFDWTKQFILYLACQTIIAMISDNEDFIQYAFNEGIDNQFISLFNIIPAKQVRSYHILPIFNIVNSCSNDERRRLAENGILTSMIQIVENENEIILKYLIIIFIQIISSVGETEEQEKPNPLYEQMKKDGSLDKLLMIFHNQYKDKEINTNAAIAIGYLMKSIPIPTQFSLDIIIHLKQKINHMNQFIVENSLTALALISECQDNHSIILAGEFIKTIITKLEFYSDNKINQLINFLIKLFKFGNTQTKEEIINEIEIDHSTVFHQNVQVSSNVNELKMMIEGYLKQKNQNFKKIEQIQTDIQQSIPQILPIDNKQKQNEKEKIINIDEKKKELAKNEKELIDQQILATVQTEEEKNNDISHDDSCGEREDQNNS